MVRTNAQFEKCLLSAYKGLKHPDTAYLLFHTARLLSAYKGLKPYIHQSAPGESELVY